MMRVGSLFSGIGGIELGLERAGGYETLWFVENDPHARAILKEHWPNAEIYEDVTSIDFSGLPRVDVLTGGFPCQDISNAGKRAGITGSRSGLWKHYLRAIREVRPMLVIAENVAALLGRGLDTVLVDLAALGYDAEWHAVPAASVGAPHRRDRILIIAYPALANTGWERIEHRRESIDMAGACGNAQEEAQEREWSRDAVGDSRAAVADAPSECERGPEHEANTERVGGDPRLEPQERSARQSVSKSCPDVADAIGHGSSEEPDRRTDTSGLGNTDIAGLAQRESESRNHGAQQPTTLGAGWWAVEPDVGRVAHGIPQRVDRIKRLGNAVVPQWAQAIGQAINEANHGGS